MSRRANGVTKTLAEEIRGGLRFNRGELMQRVSFQLGSPSGFVEFFGPLGDLARIGPANHDRSNLVLEDIRQPCWCGWGPLFVDPSEVAAKRRLESMRPALLLLIPLFEKLLCLREACTFGCVDIKTDIVSLLFAFNLVAIERQ